MKRAVAIVIGLFVAAPAFAVGNPVDVFDKPLKPILSRTEPKLILYASPNTQDQIHSPAELMGQRLKNIPFITVVHVDFRGMPGFFLGIARHFMKDSQTKANEKDLELARAAGLKPNADTGDRLHLVMEPDGAAHQDLGMASGFKQAMAVVLDSTGKEVLRAPFPEQVSAVEKALRDAWTSQHPPEAQEATSQR